MNEKSGGKLNPLLIYPESTTTNGTELLAFKRGAFIGEKRVRPIVAVQDPDAPMSIAQGGFITSISDILPIILVNLSWLGFFRIQFKVLPDFEPNEFLFKTHADKGKERW